jgi:uroporphyrinogen-III synthase
MKQPLAGKRVLVGRAKSQAGALSKLLRQAGATPIEIPFIEIVPPHSYSKLDRALREIDSYDWLILTSVNGVEVLLERARRAHLKSPKTLKVAAIGPATRAAIEKHRVKVAVTPKEYVAESVVRALRRKVKGKRVLLCRAEVARDVIPTELRKAGARVDVVEAYRTVLPKASQAKVRKLLSSEKQRIDAIVFTSSSTVKNFVDLAGKNADLKGIALVSIGPVTSATLREHRLKPTVEARPYTMTGVVRALKRHFKTKS